jgi:putative effector of murein hydrolase
MLANGAKIKYMFHSFFFRPYLNSLDYLAAAWWLTPLLLWSLVWKGLALWRSARNNQRYWFITLLVVNTAGLLEIIYLFFFAKKFKAATSKPHSKKS